MKIIKKVTIRYFRSIYTASINDCAELNVISGRNDCGKSNTLRALNLFFNQQTDWKRELSFYEDFSVQRLDSVRKESVKGKQFISVEIEFERPSTYSASLPETFSVTRTWYRDSAQYEERNNLDSSAVINKLPSKLATAKRALQAFLNRIQYEYVPAIKDRPYTLHLLARLQKNMLDLEGPQSASLTRIVKTMSDTMRKQVAELNSEFKSATGLSAGFKSPTEMSALFHAFNVVTDSNTDQPIALQARGDGIQARYLSSVLYALASQSRRFFIWGFEEPENSLEMGATEKLAKEFSTLYAKKSQIFLTTHSPAFISLEGAHVARFRTFQDDYRTQLVNLDGKGKNFEHMESLERELGMLQIQEKIHQIYAAQIAEFHDLQKIKEKIHAELRSSKLPLVLVEGKSDKLIIDTAWEKLYKKPMPFKVRVADPAGDGGTGGAGMLAKTIESVHPDDGRKCIAIFDQDHEGIKSFQGLSKNFTLLSAFNDCKVHKNKHSYVFLLPAPSYRSDYVDAQNHMIEYMFDDHALGTKHRGRGLTFSQGEAALLVNGKKIKITQSQQLQLGFELLQHRVIISGKDTFSETIVPKLEADAFAGFVPLFELIGNLLSLE
ncbi:MULTISPECIES: ATP-binding protein [unclassified Herbaspirillum]|uniref:ATP-dependent nuclease n=1 Tax=unclassified Herbaspirillum TaxID=2624150 RepID=UPI000E2F49C3|nr:MULTISPECIES: ATP-binding protein [unclassified Herbaspirillum]RFB73968.1 ATP-binding protein [Herbaspirillum sp. 3R-3a1]TFI10221.1 ATP-binding protein [Herbaspirillum sp. 3R11]TFI16125.1 ATP-binding protein [Herbaspirillum sp. 3R-11]TFI22852.1 ATP-binding protein [Herbaspirillum sp. 3C11]